MNELFYGVQDKIYKDYTLLKNDSIYSLLSSYVNAYEYIAEVFFDVDSLNRTYNVRIDFNQEIDKAFIQARDYLTSEFKTQLVNMQSASINSVVEPFRYLDRNTSELVVSDMRVNSSSLIELFANTKGVSDVGISSHIWNVRNTGDIRQILQQGLIDGSSPEEVAEQLQQYVLEGYGFKQAYTLAYTELTHGYSKMQVDNVRIWNAENPDLYLLIEQYLSPSHTKYDICDELAGFYDPLASYIPKIGRHPHCNCGQRMVPEEQVAATRYVKASREKYIDGRLNLQELGIQDKVKNKILQPTTAEGRGTSSTNIWNSYYETITQELSGDDLNRALQSLQNIVDVSDPSGKKVSSLIERLHKIERQVRLRELTVNQQLKYLPLEEKIKSSAFGQQFYASFDKATGTIKDGGYNFKLDSNESRMVDELGIQFESVDTPLSNAGPLENTTGSFDYLQKKVSYAKGRPTPEINRTVTHELGHVVDRYLGRPLSENISEALSETSNDFASLMTNDNQFRVGTYKYSTQWSDNAKFIIKNRTESRFPYDLLIEDGLDFTDPGLKFVKDLYDYYYQPKELFAEGYALYKLKPSDMISEAPELYKFYDSLEWPQ